MNSSKLSIMLLVFFILSGCLPATVPLSTQASPSETTTTSTVPPTQSATIAPSATPEMDFPEGCVNLAEAPLDTDLFNGLLIITDIDNYHNYFFDPKSNRLLDIVEKKQLLWDSPESEKVTVRVSPNKKFIQVQSIFNYDINIMRTVDKIIKTYDAQGQEDWNRGRWLDNEHMFFQYWEYPHGNTIVIYNPFTEEQKEIQLDLPNPHIVIESLGKVAWVKADIDSTLKRVLYNDKDEKLILWDLDTKKEITFLPSPTNLLNGTWSPDGKKFAILSPSQKTLDTSVANEIFVMDMNGAVKKLTNFNQTFPFAKVSIRPSWSPDGRRIAYWLKISNVANADTENLRQWLAITDTTTLETQVYCLSPNKPPTGGGDIVWSPDSAQVIVNTDTLSEEVKPVFVDLAHLTQSKLDTHGLWVVNWMTP